MAAVNSKKNTKAPVKKTAAKKEAPAKKVAVATSEDAEAGSKRKRVTFSKKLTEEEPKTKKVAVTKKKVVVVAEPVENEESDEEIVAIQKEEIVEEEDLTEEQEEALRREILGDIASSGDEDSSDDEVDAIDSNSNVVALDTEKLKESMAETKKTFDKKASKPTTKAAKVEEKGVVFVGRIPHGFYENEMRGYFSQFGDISRLRLSRNKKTGNSKHYAFIEFESEDVAQIVSETMDNYLLFGKLLKCKVIPTEKVHEKLFVGANMVYKPKKNVIFNRQNINKPKTSEELLAKHAKLIADEQVKREKLKAAGIEYDFPGFAKSV